MFHKSIAKHWYVRGWGLFLALLGLTAASGCRLPGSTATFASDTANPFEKHSTPEQTVQMASAAEPMQQGNSETDLASVLAELNEIGDIDPQAREKLTQDLQSVKPELWPLMIQQFKSALAYRQQIARHNGELPQSDIAENAKPQITSKVKATPVSYTPESQPATSPQILPDLDSMREPPETEPVIISDASPRMPTVEERSHFDSATLLPPPPKNSQFSAVGGVTRDAMVRQSTYTRSTPSVTDWQDDLNSAVAKLQSSVNAQPSSTAEMHEHVKLRILQLMAGNRGEAMVPVPGASPALQDYWSKQLFAISTHLDHEHQPDEKRRISSSLYHLDQARAKLAQLATLQVRNLSIVESVDGFGAYKLRESREFRPGEPVSLYAEVENLQSESTEEGYRALLSTSYEVVDISGQRVDGRQFPDVEDICKNPRRDFHMKYGVMLPERIYPGEYQLRLTITDQLSHKIGHASVSFVIVE